MYFLNLWEKQTGVSEHDLQTKTFLFIIHKPQVFTNKETLTVKSCGDVTKLNKS